MIFLTVGAQMPFDRLVRTVDEWAGETQECEIFAQIGSSRLRPSNMEWQAFLDPPEFRRRLFEADVVVTHAGMGAIITALEFGKPVLVMPRRADLSETRNDHQFGTARAFSLAGRVSVAWNEDELRRSLDGLSDIAASKRIASHASFQLLDTLRNFIRDGATTPADVPAEPEIPSDSTVTARPISIDPAEAQPRKAA